MFPELVELVEPADQGSCPPCRGSCAESARMLVVAESVSPLVPAILGSTTTPPLCSYFLTQPQPLCRHGSRSRLSRNIGSTALHLMSSASSNVPIFAFSLLHRAAVPSDACNAAARSSILTRGGAMVARNKHIPKWASCQTGQHVCVDVSTPQDHFATCLHVQPSERCFRQLLNKRREYAPRGPPTQDLRANSNPREVLSQQGQYTLGPSVHQS